jgi:hypothetical protein
VLQSETLKCCHMYHTVDQGDSDQTHIQEMLNLNPSVAVLSD